MKPHSQPITYYCYIKCIIFRLPSSKRVDSEGWQICMQHWPNVYLYAHRVNENANVRLGLAPEMIQTNWSGVQPCGGGDDGAIVCL